MAYSTVLIDGCNCDIVSVQALPHGRSHIKIISEINYCGHSKLFSCLVDETMKYDKICEDELNTMELFKILYPKIEEDLQRWVNQRNEA